MSQLTSYKYFDAQGEVVDYFDTPRYNISIKIDKTTTPVASKNPNLAPHKAAMDAYKQ